MILTRSWSGLSWSCLIWSGWRKIIELIKRSGVSGRIRNRLESERIRMGVENLKIRNRLESGRILSRVGRRTIGSRR
jgi:hypothetical protein